MGALQTNAPLAAELTMARMLNCRDPCLSVTWGTCQRWPKMTVANDSRPEVTSAVNYKVGHQGGCHTEHRWLLRRTRPTCSGFINVFVVTQGRQEPFDLAKMTKLDEARRLSSRCAPGCPCSQSGNETCSCPSLALLHATHQGSTTSLRGQQCSIRHSTHLSTTQ